MGAYTVQVELLEIGLKVESLSRRNKKIGLPLVLKRLLSLRQTASPEGQTENCRLASFIHLNQPRQPRMLIYGAPTGEQDCQCNGDQCGNENAEKDFSFHGVGTQRLLTIPQFGVLTIIIAGSGDDCYFAWGLLTLCGYPALALQ